MMPDASLRLPLTTADALHHPEQIAEQLTGEPWRRHHLALGVPGIALLHIELAARGLRPWQRAHDWLAAALTTPVTSGSGTHLFYGAPAVAYALSCAQIANPGPYANVLRTLDQAIADDTLRRVAVAHTRLDDRLRPRLAEFDLLRGATGLGVYLLRRDPHGPALRAILSYLVRLTEPAVDDGDPVPGWWVHIGPNGKPADLRFPGGHANTGLAHGIGGPLALLALAALCQVRVDGQQAAIERICAWLDQWRTITDHGPVWPYHINRAQLRSGRHDLDGTQRPSWCYGSAGLARAQQLAAQATGDQLRKQAAEEALTAVLAQPGPIAATTDATVCHGYMGLAHAALRTATTAELAGRATHLWSLGNQLAGRTDPGVRPDHIGFLEGAPGIALAALWPATGEAPRSGWDACLLLPGPTVQKGR